MKQLFISILIYCGFLSLFLLWGGRETAYAQIQALMQDRDGLLWDTCIGPISSKQISEILRIDKTTVETYKERIKVKLGCDTVVEIVVHAIKNKIIAV